MRKPHLGSVDGAIAGTLDNGKNVAILGVKNYLFDVSLYTQMCQLGRVRVWLWRCLWSHLEAFESGAGHCASAQNGVRWESGRMTKWGCALHTLEKIAKGVGRILPVGHWAALRKGCGESRDRKENKEMGVYE